MKKHILILLSIAAFVATMESCKKAPHLWDWNKCFYYECDGNHLYPQGYLYYPHYDDCNTCGGYDDGTGNSGTGNNGTTNQTGPCEVVCVGGSAKVWLTAYPYHYNQIQMVTIDGIAIQGSINGGGGYLLQDIQDLASENGAENVALYITATGSDWNPSFLVTSVVF